MNNGAIVTIADAKVPFPPKSTKNKRQIPMETAFYFDIGQFA